MPKISALPAMVAGDLTTADLLPVVDSTGPTTRKTTIDIFRVDFFAGVGMTATPLAIVTTITATGLIKTTVTTQQLALHYDGSNHLAVTVSSAGAVTYNATGASASHLFSEDISVTGAATFTTKLASTTALATPGALAATTFNAFASTVSGAALMGYGTTNDVSLMNRAGTVCLGVGPNTTLINIPGSLSVVGVVGLGGGTSSARAVYMTTSTLVQTSQFGFDIQPVFSTAATTSVKVIAPTLVMAAGAFTTTAGYSIYIGSPTLSNTAVTSIYGMLVQNQGQAKSTNAYGIYIDAQSGAGTINIGLYNAGTSTLVGAVAASSSVLSIHATAGIGYATGAGGAVTQGTNRTTGVTLDKICGAITLISAAGQTGVQTFTVTDSAVAATDTIVICQKSGTDLNELHVTAVAAGSFNVSFWTTGGTTVEQPVFNYAIIKAVAA